MFVYALILVRFSGLVQFAIKVPFVPQTHPLEPKHKTLVVQGGLAEGLSVTRMSCQPWEGAFTLG